MISTKEYNGAAVAKRGWTTFEFLLLAPFALLLWYIATEPLVVPVKKEASPPPAAAAVSAAEPSAEPARVVFVTTGNTTVFQRIAPVASVNLEEVEQVAAAVSEPAPVTPAPVEAAPAPVPATAAALRIVISDGTGVEGFAKGVAQQLEQAGMTVSATAAIAGMQKRNVIFFRDGFEEDAARLSKLFVQPPVLINNTNTRKSSDAADVRLVLGSAAAREKTLLVSKTEAPKL